MKQPLTPDQKGAVDLNECPTRKCHCGLCAVCGYAKHTAIHGPLYGQPPGSQPYGHEFVEISHAPFDKAALTHDLTSPDNSTFLNALIRQIVHRAETLADVHYGLSASAQALKAANQKVTERMKEE